MRVEYYFDFSCPYAYLGATQIERVAADAHAELVWKPFLLGGVFRAVNTPDNLAATLSPPKARHNGMDMMRWAEWFDVPLTMPPGHPQRTVRALRALLSLPEESWPPVIHALYRAYWIDSEPFVERDTLERALTTAGIDANTRKRAHDANDDPAIKAELRTRTDEAIARGIFGAPTMFVDAGDGDTPMMFWGQDRLDMVGRALEGWRA